MVQCRWGEPSTVEVDIMDGSESKAEPSTLSLNIADSSMSIGLTVHAEGMNHGWFGVQSGTFHA